MLHESSVSFNQSLRSDEHKLTTPFPYEILLSYITTCRSYFYNDCNQYDRIGYNGIDIGFNNEEEANMIIFCDYQVSTTSLCYALCQMIIYIKEKIKNYYIEEFRICQMYHCI